MKELRKAEELPNADGQKPLERQQGSGLQRSFLVSRLMEEKLMDGGAWKAAVHGVAEGRTWRIPGMGEPGGLPSMGSRRVRHD